MARKGQEGNAYNNGVVLFSLAAFLVRGGKSHTSAIKKTLKQSARLISPNFKPVGYSTPSAEVMTLVNSAVVSATLGSTLSPSRTEGSGVGDCDPCRYDSPSSFFSCTLTFALLKVSEVESSMTVFLGLAMTKIGEGVTVEEGLGQSAKVDVEENGQWVGKKMAETDKGKKKSGSRQYVLSTTEE
jgi:hypothetical protein